MATVKKMARVVILSRLGKELSNLPVFEEVGALPDAELTTEYNGIIAQKRAEIAQRRDALANGVVEVTAVLNAQEAELT